jgi:hypothetical protein
MACAPADANINTIAPDVNLPLKAIEFRRHKRRVCSEKKDNLRAAASRFRRKIDATKYFILISFQQSKVTFLYATLDKYKTSAFTPQHFSNPSPQKKIQPRKAAIN